MPCQNGAGWLSGAVTGIGTVINVIAIMIGGTIGLATQRDLPVRRQQQLKSFLGLLVILFAAFMIWQGFREGTFLQAAGQFGIALLATTFGRPIGRLLRIQKGMNRLGRHAATLYQSSQNGALPHGRFNTGMIAGSIFFCASPLALLGAVQDGLTGAFPLLCAKAVMDGMAAWTFVRTLGVGVMFSSLAVLAFQGAITLLLHEFPFPESEMSEAVLVTGGTLALCTSLLVFEVKKVELGDYLPALVIAPLLAWWWM